MTKRTPSPPARSRHEPECIEDCLIAQSLDGLRIGLILTDPDGRIIWLNRVAENVLGLKRSKCLGRPLARLIKDPRLASFWRDAAQAEETRMAEISVQWPELHELKVNSTQCLSLQGGLISRALVFCDLTQEHTVQVELSRTVAHRLLDIVGDDADSAETKTELTAREVQVLGLVGKGMANQQIAAHLCISGSTVRSHLKSIYRKLGIGSRPEAVSYAVRNGLA